MVAVWIAVVPLTESVVNPVSASLVPLPNTASPLMPRLCAVPATVPPVVTLLPLSTVLPPSVRLSP